MVPLVLLVPLGLYGFCCLCWLCWLCWFHWVCMGSVGSVGPAAWRLSGAVPLEHANYFGVDERLGPVAVSIRRERLDDLKEPGPHFQFRIIFRTSEVGGGAGGGGCGGLGGLGGAALVGPAGAVMAVPCRH